MLMRVPGIVMDQCMQLFRWGPSMSVVPCEKRPDKVRTHDSARLAHRQCLRQRSLSRRQSFMSDFNAIDGHFIGITFHVHNREMD